MATASPIANSSQAHFQHNMQHQRSSADRGYIPIADHGLIGNLRTAALVSVDGSIESYCVPHFDSPSIFARILDKDKGGHFSITPTIPFSTKQAYLPSSNVLQTKFLNEQGVVSVIDFLPRQSSKSSAPFLPWLIRHVEVIRGAMPIRMECAPAFNYARSAHDTTLVPDTSVQPPLGLASPTSPSPSTPAQLKALFSSPGAELTLDLRYIAEASADATSAGVPTPRVQLRRLDLSARGHKGPGVFAEMDLVEGQAVTFILRTPPDEPGAAEGREQAGHHEVSHDRARELGIPLERLVLAKSKLRAPEDPVLTRELLRDLLKSTNDYWNGWIRKSSYKGSWKESVHRSALALKLLIFEPTGAIVASPTFSLPEYIGGTRNWDYRASWIRDASFTLYALIRLGFTYEANAYVDFILERVKDKNPDGSLQIMYTIHGDKIFPEVELTHLDGHKSSRPVRIGNGAIDHLQLDIYGELMDCIYLGQKFGKPLSYDMWLEIRSLVDYVVRNCNRADLSIWEVRNKERHFTYSKIMLWVAIDRGLRLAEKRSFPCPKRMEWLAARDYLYEEIMEKAWNPVGQFFGQSYENPEVVDSAVLIMPLVFFTSEAEPRFISTLKQILKTPARGGLTSNNLVFRYDVNKADDGVGGEEGTFSLCTLWCVEALTRAGRHDKALLQRGVTMFEEFLLYLNHVGLCTEEISDAGEALGNAVQGFSHVTLISAAYNLSRTLEKYKI